MVGKVVGFATGAFRGYFGRRRMVSRYFIKKKGFNSGLRVKKL